MGLNLIMELSSARHELGEKPFSGTYNEILYAKQWGICQELVLDNPRYEDIAAELVKVEEHYRPVLRNVGSLLHAEAARLTGDGSNGRLDELMQYKSEEERITRLYEMEIHRIVSQLK